MKVLKKFRFLFLFLIVLNILFNLSPLKIYGVETNDDSYFNVLVINSYNSSSEWENFVLTGIKDSIHNIKDIKLEIEYLDIRKRNDLEYINSFLNFINTKYKNSKINAILTIDDEAFSFARDNLFNESSIFYNKPIVFTGVNKPLTLTEDEKDFITGVIETENNIELINMILNLHNDITSINLILDNAVYSNIVKENILKKQNFFNKPVHFNSIQGKYIEDIVAGLSFKKKENTINIIIGNFISRDDDTPLLLKDAINKINSISSAPIYTKSQPYIINGAVGGIVDWGEYHGNAIGNIIINLYNGNTPKDTSFIYDALEQTVFNYDLLYKYNINPLLLPENSIFINKGPLDLLLPRSLKILVWTFIISFTLLLLFLIYKLFKGKSESIKQKKLIAQAQESEKLKTEFITNITHELRTPLNIIINASKLILDKVKSEPIEQSYVLAKLEFIHKNSNRLLRLINNVIDLSRIGGGYVSLNFQYANAVEIVENLVMLTVDFAKSQDIEIIFDTEEEEIFTSIDIVKLERIMLNLISNAIKFTPKGGIIEVNIKKLENNINIEVKDTGIGIPSNHISNIFDKFNQVDPSLTRENEGSGLGLSITKALINLLNGSISVSSDEGSGSKFTVTLPIVLKESTISSKLPSSNLEQTVKLELSDIKDKS